MEKYLWTKHVRYKMRQYSISEQRVKGVLRYPDRVEQSIVPNMVAAMRVYGSSGRRQEIWVMYERKRSGVARGSVRCISVWRYPGISPKRDPLPDAILEEILNENG